MVSFRGQKRLGHAQTGHLFRQASQLPFHVVVPFPPRRGSEITADHGTSTELTEVYPLRGWVNEFL